VVPAGEDAYRRADAVGPRPVIGHDGDPRLGLPATLTVDAVPAPGPKDDWDRRVYQDRFPPSPPVSASAIGNASTKSRLTFLSRRGCVESTEAGVHAGG
jgi:hypothetical protein